MVLLTEKALSEQNQHQIRFVEKGIYLLTRLLY